MEIFIKYLGIVQATAEALRFPTPHCYSGAPDVHDGGIGGLWQRG